MWRLFIGRILMYLTHMDKYMSVNSGSCIINVIVEATSFTSILGHTLDVSLWQSLILIYVAIFNTKM